MTCLAAIGGGDSPVTTWLYAHFGINGSGPWYAFWSGIGSDIGELAIIGGLISIYRKHSCHVHRCWRIGKHPVDGTPFVTCRAHHPTIDGQITAADVAQAHIDAA